MRTPAHTGYASFAFAAVEAAAAALAEVSRADVAEEAYVFDPDSCGCRHFYTTHTEPVRDGRIRRRKACRHCGRKLLTFESTVPKPACASDIDAS